MIKKKDLESRLKKLNWTPYRLAKEICTLRAEESQIPPVTRYQSAVNKAVSEPRKSKLETVEELVHALGGTLEIVWNDQPESTKISLQSDVASALSEIAKINGMSVEEVVDAIARKALKGFVELDQ